MHGVNGRGSPRNGGPAGSVAKSKRTPSVLPKAIDKFTIPSSPAAGRNAQCRIIRQVERGGFTCDALFGVRLAVEEALANAIKHGNGLNPKKRVHIQVSINPKRAEIIIEDEGSGFRRCQVPDPTRDENLCRPNGRGILLMESYMNKVQYSHGGRRVRLVKEHSGR